MLNMVRIAEWPSAGKELSSWLSACTDVTLCKIVVFTGYWSLPFTFGEGRHPCRTPNVELKSLVLPLNRTTLWAFHIDFQWTLWCWNWCCISSLVPIRLHLFISYPVKKGFLEIYEAVVEIVLMLQVFLAEDRESAYLLWNQLARPKWSL